MQGTNIAGDDALKDAILDNANFSCASVSSSKLEMAKSLNGTTVPKDAYDSLKGKFPEIIKGEDQ